VRSYLRNRAGLSPVNAGVGILNQGHRSLYERELLFLHDVLPKDTGVHDGLQLLDGGDGSRHLSIAPPAPAPGSATTPAPAVATVPMAPSIGSVPETPAAAEFTPPASAVAQRETPSGPVLPTPPHAMRLAPLPEGTPILPGSQASREALRVLNASYDEEEDDEIRPVANEYASQWAAYRAARR